MIMHILFLHFSFIYICVIVTELYFRSHVGLNLY